MKSISCSYDLLPESECETPPSIAHLSASKDFKLLIPTEHGFHSSQENGYFNMASEMDEELRALQKWCCMLEDAQRTAAIYHLIQYTTLAQVEILTNVLKQREMKFRNSQVPRKDFKAAATCRVVFNKNISSTTNFLYTPTRHSSALSTRSSGTLQCTPHPRSSSTGYSQSTELHNHDSRILTHPPIPNLTPTSTPTLQPLRSTLPVHRSLGLPPHPVSTTRSERQNPALLALCRLTLGPSFPSSPARRKGRPRKRKIPAFPKDATDPDWLLKWLKQLRLHKYVENLEGVSPDELLDLKEEDLLERGVDTLGARRKLLVALREARESQAH